MAGHSGFTVNRKHHSRSSTVYVTVCLFVMKRPNDNSAKAPEELKQFTNYSISNKRATE
jgi:hypothetical protein